jgi:hypothetical protein
VKKQKKKKEEEGRKKKKIAPPSLPLVDHDSTTIPAPSV